MSRSDFDLTLSLGEEFEAWLREMFDGRPLEAKDQARSRSHVFIEDESWGRPGGIAVTKADLWAIRVAPGRAVALETEIVRDLYALAIARFGRRSGGDEGNARGAIVPKTWLVRDPRES